MAHRPLWHAARVLITDRGEQWTAITQPAHAWLSGQIARAWGNARFAAPDPAADVCLGVEQHDIAWTDWDRRPPLHPDGRVPGFLEVAWRPRLRLWEEAPDRAVTQSAWAALLVALHGRNLHRRFAGPDGLSPEHAAAVAAYLAGQDALIERLIARVGTTSEQAERAGELVFCLDALSLTLCLGWGERDLPAVDGHTVRMSALGPGDVATLDPWPLAAESLEVFVHERTFTERFTDEAALHAALDAAPLRRRTFTLVPG